MKINLYLLIIILLTSCANEKNGVEKHQYSRNKIVNIKPMVREIVEDDVLIGDITSINLIKDYLVVEDYNSVDTLIHIFNKNDFSYITGFGMFGQGPYEIANLGGVTVEPSQRYLDVADWGKRKIFAYDLDSLLSKSLSYRPQEKLSIGEMQFPDRYIYINDTLCVARVITKVKGSPFMQTLAFWNMTSNQLVPFEYLHPEIQRKRVRFAVSAADDLIVECYLYHDLITIYDLKGNLKYNIYGECWDNRVSNKIHYFDKVEIYKDNIIVGYSGGDNMTDAYFPTVFMIFDLEGNYVKTLDVGYKIQDFCIDKDNHRIIMALADEIQFAYLDLQQFI